MKFDISTAFDLIEEVTKLRLDPRTSMTRLLDYCEAVNPSPVWKNFRKLDFEGDTEKMKDWLEDVLSSEPPANNIKGYWFGLFNPVLENGEASCGLYISGSTRYDANDQDWAVWDDDSYLPEKKYSNSKVLHEIYRLVEENDMLGDGEYVLCLGYACFVVSSICQVVNPQLLFGASKARAIVVGFDSGDWIVVSEN